MEVEANYKPEFESLKELLLDIAQERSPDALLKMIVNRLAARPHIALARIWLIKPGDICPNCLMREECPDQTQCLHLVASRAKPASKASGQAWYRMDGDFQRFPLNVRVIGRIGATGLSEHRLDTMADEEWIGSADR